MAPFRRFCKRYRLLWLLLLTQVTGLCWLLAVNSRDDLVTGHVLPNQLWSANGSWLLPSGWRFSTETVSTDWSEAAVADHQSWKFRHFDQRLWSHNQQIHLRDDPKEYFRQVGSSGRKCFIAGTDWSVSTSEKCVCVADYYGLDCGIPDAVWYGYYAGRPRDRKKLKIRPRPRRIVHAVPVNHEFDFFEARVETLHDLVDVFILHESNYTAYGDGKQLDFLAKLRQGWLKPYQHQMLYILLDFFTEKSKDSGWYADAYIRTHMSREALPMIHGLRDDDLFLLHDADELPLRETLQFLRLYDGYTEPIRFNFRWNIFGFFWLQPSDKGLLERMPLIGQLFGQAKERTVPLWAVCTMGMFRDVYHSNAMLLRRNVWQNDLLKERVANYSSRHPVREWDIGSLGHYAGFHCSWCYRPEGIRTKLLSAQKNDEPRWGNYPEKTNVSYIAGLIRSGGWFDGKRPFIAVTDTTQKFYAPKFILDNPKRFEYLLRRPKS